MNDADGRLQERLGYVFNDPDLLGQALTHRSCGAHNNERLEFLGDAILGFVVADLLYAANPDAHEGRLTRLRAHLVRRETLAAVARNLQLGECLCLGAVARPDLLGECADAFGRQCVVLAIDAKSDGTGGWEVWTHGGRQPTGIDAVAWAAEGAKRGAGEILLTSMDKDGTRSGYDIDLLAAVRRAVSIPVIASGGAGDTPDMVEALTSGGADAVLAASIFHHGTYTVGEVKKQLTAAGVAVREDSGIRWP